MIKKCSLRNITEEVKRANRKKDENKSEKVVAAQARQSCAEGHSGPQQGPVPPSLTWAARGAPSSPQDPGYKQSFHPTHLKGEL